MFVVRSGDRPMHEAGECGCESEETVRSNRASMSPAGAANATERSASVRIGPQGLSRERGLRGTNADVLAAVCELEGVCGVVVARMEPGQAFAGISVTDREAQELISRGLSGRRLGRCRVIEAGTFASIGDAGVGALLSKHGALRVVRVLPASTCLVRPVTVPGLSASNAMDNGEDGLAMALELAGEAEAPNVPAWRRSVGWVHVLHESHAPGAILQAWPMTAEASEWPHAGRETLISPVGAMYGLAMLQPRIGLLSTVDRASGSVLVFAPGPDRTVGRSSRSAGADARAWSAGCARTVNETARAAGWNEAGLDGMADVLPETGLVAWTMGVGGASGEEGLTPTVVRPSALALCLGALAVATIDRASVSVLAGMTREEVRPDVPAWRRCTTWMARPRNAAAIVAASLLIALGAPLGSAIARESTLRARAKELDLDRRLGESERRIGFYSLLRERRWPMAKLLADLAGSAPVGVEIDLLDLNHGEPVTVRGRAERPELVAVFRENLTKSRVFTQVTTPSVEADASGVKFQLIARIEGNRAFYPGERANDFAKEPLAVRLYGENGASTADFEATAGPAERGRSASRSGRPARDSSAGSDASGTREEGRSGGSSGSRSASAVAAAPVPAPLSEADFAAMDATKAMLEWSSRKAAASRATDEAIKRRLNEESERARQRMLELRNAGGGGS